MKNNIEYGIVATMQGLKIVDFCDAGVQVNVRNEVSAVLFN